MRPLIALLAAVAIGGCARKQPALASADAVSSAPCDAARLPEDTDGEWREVRGDGFTYCVPADWKAIGARAQRWTSTSVDVAWNDPAFFERRVPFVVPTRGGTGAPFGQRVVTETLDGHTVRLEIQDGGDAPAWSAAASWLEPSLRFYATARSASASREVLAVIRSVRFGR